MKRWIRGGIVLCFLAVIYFYAKKDIDDCEQNANRLKGIVLPQFPEISGTVEVQAGEYVDDTVLLAYTQAIENMLESNETDCFVFMRGEEAICYFEGKGQDYDYRFALYKKTQDANIVFVNMIYIDSLTELHMYTLEGDDHDKYRKIKPGQYLKESEIRDVVFSWIKNENVWEAVLLKSKETKADIVTDENTVDTLLNKTMDLLKEKDFEYQHLMYDGVRDFLGKSYYVISDEDDMDTHIMRTQSYYVDASNGNVYRMSEDEVSLRNELYYIGNCNTMIYNICTLPKSDYENTLLWEYFQEDLEYDKAKAEAWENSGEGAWVPLTIEYFLFDFNADGLEDYVVCVTGSFYGGSAGNLMRICVQQEDGTLKTVFSAIVQFHEPEFPNGHDAVAVMNQSSGGFYSVVLPGSNEILRYDPQSERYKFEKFWDWDQREAVYVKALGDEVFEISGWDMGSIKVLYFDRANAKILEMMPHKRKFIYGIEI